MVGPQRIVAGDLASFLADLAGDTPCVDGSLVCYLDYLLIGAVLMAILVAVGFLLAIAFSVVAARVERAGRPARARRKRVVSGPVHTDGVWVRLVEDERGRRVVEVLDRGDWTPSTRELSQFAIDVPVTPPPRG